MAKQYYFFSVLLLFCNALAHASLDGQINLAKDVWLKIPFFVAPCLTKTNPCELSTSETNILKILASQHSSEISSQEGGLRFLSGNEHPQVFDLVGQGRRRSAVTGLELGSPIYLNTDNIAYKDFRQAMGPLELLGLLIHELGHHQNIKEHEALDMLGSKIRRYWEALAFDELSPSQSQRVFLVHFPTERGKEQASPFFWIWNEKGGRDLSKNFISSLPCPTQFPVVSHFLLQNPNWIDDPIRDNLKSEFLRLPLELGCEKSLNPEPSPIIEERLVGYWPNNTGEAIIELAEGDENFRVAFTRWIEGLRASLTPPAPPALFVVRRSEVETDPNSGEKFFVIEGQTKSEKEGTIVTQCSVSLGVGSTQYDSVWNNIPRVLSTPCEFNEEASSPGVYDIIKAKIRIPLTSIDNNVALKVQNIVFDRHQTNSLVTQANKLLILPAKTQTRAPELLGFSVKGLEKNAQDKYMVKLRTLYFRSLQLRSDKRPLEILFLREDKIRNSQIFRKNWELYYSEKFLKPYIPTVSDYFFVDGNIIRKLVIAEPQNGIFNFDLKSGYGENILGLNNIEYFQYKKMKIIFEDFSEQIFDIPSAEGIVELKQ